MPLDPFFAERLRVHRRYLVDQAHYEDALTVQIPSVGTVPTLRTVLTRLDDHAIDLDDLSIHTPDLDDVFFAVTGNDRR